MMLNYFVSSHGFSYEFLTDKQTLTILTKRLAMADQYGLIYGGALIAGGLVGLIRGGSIISLVLGAVFGAWSLRNTTHPTRNNRLANFLIALLIGVVMLVRFYITGKWFPAVLVVILSAVQVFFNSSALQAEPATKNPKKN